MKLQMLQKAHRDNEGHSQHLEYIDSFINIPLLVYVARYCTSYMRAVATFRTQYPFQTVIVIVK